MVQLLILQKTLGPIKRRVTIFSVGMRTKRFNQINRKEIMIKILKMLVSTFTQAGIELKPKKIKTTDSQRSHKVQQN